MMVGMLIERFVPKRTVGGVGGVVAARARRESGGRGAGIGIVVADKVSLSGGTMRPCPRPMLRAARGRRLFLG